MKKEVNQIIACMTLKINAIERYSLDIIPTRKQQKTICVRGKPKNKFLVWCSNVVGDCTKTTYCIFTSILEKGIVASSCHWLFI